jgi:hypothetical protein
MTRQNLLRGGGLVRGLVSLVVISLLSLGPMLLTAAPAWALIHAHPDETTATGVVRSLESLRDLDYQSWQVVAYREGAPRPEAPITLRIVSYPGRVRLDHPTPLNPWPLLVPEALMTPLPQVSTSMGPPSPLRCSASTTK